MTYPRVTVNKNIIKKKQEWISVSMAEISLSSKLGN